jgi:hypothetical protein
MIYAMSDIHGCIEELKEKMEQKKLWLLREIMSRCFWSGLIITEIHIPMVRRTI